MSASTSIEWTGATWNPIRGCSRVSEGCRHCYAETVAARFAAKGLAYEGLTTKGKWNGTLRFVPEHLEDPLRWETPRRIFVNSMSDLFHEQVKDTWLDQIFEIMATARQHTFQILTKRPARMLDYRRHVTALPNVWLGVSVEDEATADERIPFLLLTPSVVKWVSYEPALEGVDFSPFLPVETIDGVELESWLDWIVIGGESGTGARAFNLAWARETIRQCRETGVPCFVKQLGRQPIMNGQTLPLTDRKGGDWDEWPEDLRVRDFPLTNDKARR